MLNAILGAVGMFVVLFIALCVFSVREHRKIQARARDAHYATTAMEVANGVRQRRQGTTPEATTHNEHRENVMPTVSVYVTRAIDTDGSDIFNIQWINHHGDNDAVDIGEKFALAGALMQSALGNAITVGHDD